MHWNITHNTERKYVHAYQGGRYTLEDEVAFLDSIFNSAFWRRGMPLVVNIDSMEMDNVDDRVITIASRMVILLNNKLGNARFALVCDDDEKLAVGHKWQSSVAPHLDAEVKIFGDERAAVDWATESVGPETAES